MAKFVEEILPEDIVLVSVRGDASKKMTSEAYEALRSLGGTGKQLGYRQSYALVGCKKDHEWPKSEAYGRVFDHQWYIRSPLQYVVYTRAISGCSVVEPIAKRHAQHYFARDADEGAVCNSYLGAKDVIIKDNVVYTGFPELCITSGLDDNLREQLKLVGKLWIGGQLSNQG